MASIPGFLFQRFVGYCPFCCQKISLSIMSTDFSLTVVVFLCSSSLRFRFSVFKRGSSRRLLFLMVSSGLGLPLQTVLKCSVPNQQALKESIRHGKKQNRSVFCSSKCKVVYFFYFIFFIIFFYPTRPATLSDK